MRDRKCKRSSVMIIRMAELEHARLKVWANEQGTNMSQIVRDRVADIIAPRAMQRTQQGQ